MHIREAIKVVELPDSPQPLYEMSSLPPFETGLSFAVWVSPRGRARHDARVTVTDPPYGANPEAIYRIRPFGFVEGQRWLTSEQEHALQGWVALNEAALIDFWEGRIHYEAQLKTKLVNVGDAPPGNHQQAVGALRVCAPKVRAISWRGGAYRLRFDRFAPDARKVAQRFAQSGFTEPLLLATDQDGPSGILLWSAD